MFNVKRQLTLRLESVFVGDILQLYGRTVRSRELEAALHFFRLRVRITGVLQLSLFLGRDSVARFVGRAV